MGHFQWLSAPWWVWDPPFISKLKFSYNKHSGQSLNENLLSVLFLRNYLKWIFFTHPHTDYIVVTKNWSLQRVESGECLAYWLSLTWFASLLCMLLRPKPKPYFSYKICPWYGIAYPAIVQTFCVVYCASKPIERVVYCLHKVCLYIKRSVFTQMSVNGRVYYQYINLMKF